MRPGAAVARELDDLLHHVLAGHIGGMGLAGEDDLHRQREQALDVGEDEPGALVGREAAGEADRQPLAVDPARSASRAFAAAWTRQWLVGPASRDCLQFASSGARREDARYRSSSPSAGSSQVPMCTPFVTWPIGSLAGPERRPHLPRHLAVQIGYAVGIRGKTQRERSHAEAGLVPKRPRSSSAWSSRPASASS